MSKHIIVQESCPRDGWQNHKQIIPTDVKIKYIKQMIDSGAKSIEVTSFVNPKLMPQMADAKEVFTQINEYTKGKDVMISVLALNKRGADEAKLFGAENIQFVMSASEEHNLKNSNKTLEQSMNDLKNLVLQYENSNINLAVACAFGSPFGDEIKDETLKWIIEEGQSVGIKKFGFADTSGISTPINTRRMIRYISGLIDLSNVNIHLHDTYGMGMANAFVAIEEGVTILDASLSAMGGCPFAPGAKGNIATEDLVNMIHQMGYSTDYDLDKLVKISRAMCEEIGAPIGGSVTLAHD